MAVSPYIIRFNHLPAGKHEYKFRIDDSFFKNREGSIIQMADIDVDAILTKGSGSMQLELIMKGEVKVECVRCLEPMTLPIDFDRELLVRLVENPEQEDDTDAINLQDNAIEIDLEPHLYDFLSLQIPYSPVHEAKLDGQEGCNPEVLKHLKQNEAGKEGDERWSALKKFKLN